jgi:HEAT repeat protein
VLARLGPVAATTEILTELRRLIKDASGYSVYYRDPSAADTLGILCRPNDRDTRTLISLLSDSNWEIRNRVVEALGQWYGREKSTEILPVLGVLLRDKDENTRSSAAQLVARLGSECATEEIIEAVADLLLDDSREVRRDALRAIQELEYTAATPDVLAAISLLLNDNDGKDDNSLFDEAASAVGNLGPKALAPEIIQSLEGVFYDQAEAYHERAIVNCFRAAEAIGKTDSTKVTPLFLNRLIDLLHEVAGPAEIDPVLREAALWYSHDTALAVIDSLGVVLASGKFTDSIVELLHDKDSLCQNDRRRGRWRSRRSRSPF